MSGLTKQFLDTIAEIYGLTPGEAHRALDWARTAKLAAAARANFNAKIAARPGAPKPKQAPAISPAAADGRKWCLQCERRVSLADAGRCASRWCKAKPAEVASTNNQEQSHG